ncbi:MAG TPA: RHS repeat-associated core domain-containing protein [Methylomirabilota bacterium]|nr:RHS repeat-associated core domain-containing protein [Methylomirabilota bacterium]
MVPDAGVSLTKFCCWAFFGCTLNAEYDDPGPPDDPLGQGAEPVDLATGQFLLTATDLVLPARLPIVIQRGYYSRRGGIGGASPGPFGFKTTFNFEKEVQPFGTALGYIQPTGRTDLFQRQADGTFQNLRFPFLRGIVLTVAPDSTRAIRFKDGSLERYSATGRLIEQRDRFGNAITIQRDGVGNIQTITAPDGRQLRVTYDTSGRIVTITDPLNRTVSYAYDGFGRLASVTNPAGGITRYTYDLSHRLLTITDPRGTTFLTNVYDPAGRVVQQTQADGGIWRFAYTTVGSTITETRLTDPRGNTSVTRFNGARYVVEQVDALGQVTRFTRDPQTNVLLTTTDPLGRTTRVTYDTNGNAASITDPAGNVTSSTYEPVFNKATSITNPLGNVIRFEYDLQGNLTAVVDPLVARTTIAYNAFGQPVRTTDPLGNTTTFTYDATGNVATIADPLGNSTRREYDAVSRLVKQIDPRGKLTTFAYDPLNRLSQIVDATGGVTRMSYDGNGNLLTVTDARGNTITHTHDAMDRLATRTDALGRIERFEYDAAGNLIRHTDRNGRVTVYAHDAADRRVAATYADGASTMFTYDAANRVSQVADSAGGTVINQYDAPGRLAAKLGPFGTVSYQYDALGRRTRFDAPGQAPTTYGYDAASRLTQITQGAQIVSIEYDPAGRRARLILPNGVFTDYQYDAASRLTALIYRNAAGPLGDLSYQYDPSGSLVQLAGSLARTLLPEPVTTAAYDAENRQLNLGDKTLSYDGAGNLTSLTDPAGLTTYTWDARNRLVGLAGPGINASFAYDAFGRRLSKTVDSTTTHYLYDGPDIAQEVRDLGPVGYLRLLGIDAPLARNGEEFYLADSLGSIVGITDVTGSVGTRYIYNPFGSTTAEGAASENALQFTGRENDGTGLYYYRARYYAPALHRFLSQDLVMRLGANRYVYVQNTPLNAIDPFGLDTIIIHGGSPSKGPGGASRFLGGNEGLRNLQQDLTLRQEPVAIFNSGQQKDIVELAKRIQAAGRPLFIVGHSLGGQRALAVVNELLNAGITPDHVFTIDPFIANDTMAPPGGPLTNFYQMQSFINGRPIIDATNIQISGAGVGHFSITNHPLVRNTIVNTITGGLQAEAPSPGGRY